MGFPSSATCPFPGMPCSSTPADSPAQSPYPAPTVAFPFENTVGICSIGVTRLNRFTCVTAYLSLCLRFVALVTSRDAKLDSRWLAGPCRGGNPTLWTGAASLGALSATPELLTLATNRLEAAQGNVS